MSYTVKELIGYLSKCDPAEIIIGQLFTADDFTVEAPEGHEVVPSQKVMERAYLKFWDDGITKNTYDWLSEVVVEAHEALALEEADE